MTAHGPADHAAFLARTLGVQAGNIARYELPGPELQVVWVKKAGPPNPQWHYQVLGVIANVLRLDVLSPVPNPGGRQAIAQEAERLRALGALGLRTPTVLAQEPGGLLLADLGQGGAPTPTLATLLEQSESAGAGAALAVWQRGLEAVALVHAKGAYLSQAFARNLIACPDGAVGYIDFEDDPGRVLSAARCQARDWLCYLHSTALSLRAAGAQDGARTLWQAALASASAEVRETVAHSAGRMGWMKRLPRHPRWGRDTLRLAAAAELLATPG